MYSVIYWNIRKDIRTQIGAYTCSHAVEILAKIAAKAWVYIPIWCNFISPGCIDTLMLKLDDSALDNSGEGGSGKQNPVGGGG